MKKSLSLGILLTVLTLTMVNGLGLAMVPEDILHMQTASATGLSPDGRFLLYSIGRRDAGTGKDQTTLYRRDLETGKDLIIFTPEDQSWGAVWRPDGQFVVYQRSREEGVELWIMEADGGNRRRLSQGPGRWGDLHWSPNGKHLAWIAQDQAVENLPRVSEGVIVADGLGYRHLGQGYRQGQRGQIFVMEVQEGVARRLFHLTEDVRHLSWSPDSKKLVFEAKSEKNLGWTVNTDLWVIDRDGLNLRQLTHNPGADVKPRWLPDGRIAWLRATFPLWESAPMTIAVMDPALGDDGPLEMHGTGFDDWVMNFTFDGQDFYLLGAHKGCLDLVRVRGVETQFITDSRHDFWGVEMAAGRAVFTGAGQRLPGGIFLMQMDSKEAFPLRPELIIDPNERWRQKVGLTEPEPFSVQVEGRTVEGWVFKPQDMQPGEKVPTVLSIHGGPQWMYGGYFLPEFHILASNHYAVIIANPTGSMGYGMEHMAGSRGDWIERPARELMACLDWAVQEGWADENHLGVMGGSYGGHLSAAMTTQSHRFKAAAVDRMYPELISFWGTTDEKWFPEWEFGGKPWEPEAREIYLKNSPFEKVDQVRTPTLISQGHLDYRCLAAGGQMWFSALQSMQVPSRFIRFQNEGHGIRGKENQVFYQNQLLEWFDTYLRPSSEEEQESGDHD